MPGPTEVRNSSIPEATSFHQDTIPPASAMTPRKTNVPVYTVTGPTPSSTAEPINIATNRTAAIVPIARATHLSHLARRYCLFSDNS